MSYPISLHRSGDGGTNWTQIATWTTNGGPFNDFVTDTPGAGTFIYELRISSTASDDAVSVRRIALIAGNR